MALRPFRDKLPRVDPTAFVESSAQVVGDVELGAESSVWFNSVVRGDVNVIRIGARTNVQDLCCLHVTRDRHALRIGDRVTVGHGVTLHGCTIADDCLIGIGATVLDAAQIGPFCLVAAGSLVVPGTVAPEGSLLMGAPARVKRPVSASERELITKSAQSYVEYARVYKTSG